MHSPLFIHEKNVPLIKVCCNLLANCCAELPTNQTVDFLKDVLFLTLHNNKFNVDITISIIDLINSACRRRGYWVRFIVLSCVIFYLTVFLFLLFFYTVLHNFRSCETFLFTNNTRN